MTRFPILFLRGVFLFVLGVSFFWVCEALQSIKGEFFVPELSWRVPSAKVLIPLCCGIASVAVGLLSPCIDSKLGLFDVYNNEWSSVLRCVALFFGLSHAIARIDFATYSQLSLTIIGLSIALWWVFDGSSVGLGFGVVSALIATFVCQSFAWKRFSKLSHPLISVWFPCLFFSGGVVVVLIGRQLAKPDVMAVMERKVK